jgi:hypothetical protein
LLLVEHRFKSPRSFWSFGVSGLFETAVSTDFIAALSTKRLLALLAGGSKFLASEARFLRAFGVDETLKKNYNFPRVILMLGLTMGLNFANFLDGDGSARAYCAETRTMLVDVLI